MNDTTSLLLGASISFILAASLGFFGKRALVTDILLMFGAGLIVGIGYLLIFGTWAEPKEIELSPILLLSAPGLFIYFFLPLTPGYILGVLLKKSKPESDPS